MGNPLINELLIGTGFKDRFSMDQPKNDAQFAAFFLDPRSRRVLNAATGGATRDSHASPDGSAAASCTYAPPIAAPGTPAGPVADLLRLNTGVAPTRQASLNRLGLLGGDPAGFPNGRRLADDVVDIALRAVGGACSPPPFNIFPNNRLGDGVNVNDATYRTQFPYLADRPERPRPAPLDPGEPALHRRRRGAPSVRRLIESMSGRDECRHRCVAACARRWHFAWRRRTARQASPAEQRIAAGAGGRRRRTPTNRRRLQPACPGVRPARARDGRQRLLRQGRGGHRQIAAARAGQLRGAEDARVGAARQTRVRGRRSNWRAPSTSRPPTICWSTGS